jgi:transposase, IS5 family
LGDLRQAAARIVGVASVAGEIWRAEARHYDLLIVRVIEQSARRVLHGEAVPAREKLVSCSSRTLISSSRALANRATAKSST